ncbi:MAG: hypothetical protein KDA45_05175 [Planctomycetales bacterium]|nr:hypothetical protein [Planctomycetales bacterium]
MNRVVPSLSGILLLISCYLSLAARPAVGQETEPRLSPPRHSPWLVAEYQLSAQLSKYTDAEGDSHASLVFLLRDKNGLGLAVTRPGSDSLRCYFRRQLDAALRTEPWTAALAPEQLEKLVLAAEVDIARGMRRFSQLQEQLAKIEYPSGAAEARALLAPVDKLCRTGLFADDSLFDRVRQTTLGQISTQR